MMHFVSRSEENNVEKGENAGNHNVLFFLSFPILVIITQDCMVKVQGTMAPK